MIGTALVGATVPVLVVPMGSGLPGIWWGVTTLMGGRLLTLGVPYGRRTLFPGTT